MISRLLWLVFVFSLFNPVEAKPQLRWCLGTFPGFYGFNAVTKQPEGPSVLYLQEIARRANFTLVPSAETPSSRCFAQMASGETDLVINILKSGKGRADIHYIQFASRWPDRVYYASSKNLRLDTPGQLSTLTLATIRTYKLAPEMQIVLDGMKKRQLVHVDSVLTALQMAAKQRIDAALLPPTQVRAVLNNNPGLAAELKEISFPDDLVKPQPVYMGLSSHCNCPELATAIKQSIKSMQADGSSQKIFADKIIM
ncbi:MAG: transporter substrate-binding domain-containing protein [Pararheinheimera sp.]|nr:transporter substrate-binding domain-containing protein [Rheinheimera sp.]